MRPPSNRKSKPWGYEEWRDRVEASLKARADLTIPECSCKGFDFYRAYLANYSPQQATTLAIEFMNGGVW